MTMALHTGIILKRINLSQSLYLILDKSDGVIVCSIIRQGMFPGAWIEYTLRQKSSFLMADNAELVASPIINNTDDLALLHRVLEIFLICMPPGSFTPGIFECVLTLYDRSCTNFMQTSLVKKIFLCKLLTLLGFYPREKKFQNQFFSNLIYQSLDNLVSIPISIVQERDIEEWLRSCITVHMQEHRLKCGL
jgi:hypothetical protein